jgi:hypothetical protein
MEVDFLKMKKIMWTSFLYVNCECKGQVAAKTYEREQCLLQRFVGADYDDNELVYHRFNAFDPKVLCFIVYIK